MCKMIPSYLPNTSPTPPLLPPTHTPWLALNGLHNTANNAATCADAPLSHHPVVWRMPFPDSVRTQLVSFKNPKGEINNSDLKLAGSLVHHADVVDTYDVRERTLASYADNTPTVYWQRKGALTSVTAPANLLRLQALHQRHYRYVPRHDFIRGVHNLLADKASRLFHLTDAQFLAHFNNMFPQKLPWRLYTPTSRLQHAVVCALHNKPYDSACVQAPTEPPLTIGPVGALSVSAWPSTPYLRISKTQSPSLQSSQSCTATAPLLPEAGKSMVVRWKVPYGRLVKRWPV